MAPYMDPDAVSSTSDDVPQLTNGNSHKANGHSSEFVHDLLCVGFGPASLAIAIALREKFEAEGRSQPNAEFLERQPEFAWHAGMLLPGSKMQISFIKDLATLRNPKSEFTFLNYLHQHNRLVQFANLGTFLPSRIEFEDYMRWCADHFQDSVQYGQDVLEIQPHAASDGNTSHFTVTSRNLATGQIEVRHGRNVVVAIGGKPRMPAVFPAQSPKVIHSSSYARRVYTALPDKEQPYRIAVVGNGQSAAELFNDLQSRYPNSKTSLIIKDTALRPSDDSPFVNEVFNPERVATFYDQLADNRSRNLASDKGTNYGVVRLELLEHIYNTLYQQRIRTPDEQDWQHHIISSRVVSNVQSISQKGPFVLQLSDVDTGAAKENMEVDAIFVATGYTRDAHEEMMKPLESLAANQGATSSRWHVQKNYKVSLDETRVQKDAGVWLQGCNQGTHGLADTLLSILAVRGGEVVDAMFNGQ